MINTYTLEEKIAIGKKYLIQKQIKEHGLTCFINNHIANWCFYDVDGIK
jgi:ATP-dependent Lon protease